MARAIWSGTLSFGLVSIPVELYPATVDRTIHFNQFEGGTSDRIRLKRVNERTGEEVDYADIVKGYDIGGGDYVLLSPEELEAAEPGRSRTIEVLDFVGRDEVDPIYYRKAYYLVPKGEAAARAYALLRQAMLESRRVGIAMFVMRAKQYLAAIRPEDEALVLETMFFADEIVDPSKEIAGFPLATTEIRPRELEAAKLLVDSMSTGWDPAAYHDTYRQAVEGLVERKRQGEEIVTEAARREPPPVADLLEALSASVAAARARQLAERGRRPERATHRTVAGRRRTPSGGAPAQPGEGADRGRRRRRSGEPTPRAIGASTSAPAAAAGVSKSELYEQARSLGIAGRSKMSRQQLQDAVRTASARRRAS